MNKERKHTIRKDKILNIPDSDHQNDERKNTIITKKDHVDKEATKKKDIPARVVWPQKGERNPAEVEKERKKKNLLIVR